MYIDLDRLIDAVSLSPLQETVINMLMKGYTISDISETLGGSRQAYNGYYCRAVRKIVDEYNRQWSMIHGDALAKDHPRYCL